MKRRMQLVAALVLATLVGCGDADEYLRGLGVPFTVNKIYWTVKEQQGAGAPAIMRCNLDGSGVEGLLGPAKNAAWMKAPEGIALDMVLGRMYWADSKAGRIDFAGLDGSGAESGFVAPANPPLNKPFGVALNVRDHLIYWTERGSGRIRRTDTFTKTLNDSDIVDVLTDLSDPTGLALALDSSRLPGGVKKMYWIEAARGVAPNRRAFSEKGIRRWGRFGDRIGQAVAVPSEPTRSLIGISTSPGVPGSPFPRRPGWGGLPDEMVLNPAASGLIRRANLDGTNVETLVQGQTGAVGIALDLVEGRMYWTIGADVLRTTLDGANVTVVNHLVQGLYAPQAIALDLSDAGWNPSNGRKAVTHPAGPAGPCITQSPKANEFSLAYDRIVSNLNGVSTGIAYGWVK